MTKKVMVVFGTRPEVIKLASFIKELQKDTLFIPILVNSGQHLNMTKQMLELFNLKADYELKIMKEKQSLSKMLKSILNKLNPIVKSEKPDVMVSFADTSTAFGAALCAYYNKIPILHMEGGIRSYNKYDCYPEEGNRRLIDHLADWNTCQTQLDLKRLYKENIKNGIFVGNYSLDVVKDFAHGLQTKKIVLITMHRREAWGEPIKQACKAIKSLSKRFKDHLFIVSKHPNPIVSETIDKTLSDFDNIKLLDALNYDAFIKLMASSKVVMTDSGGIVQEAMFLRKPIIYLREKSEYEYLFIAPYFVSVGKNKLKIFYNTKKLLEMETIDTPEIKDFGNGTAGKQTLEYLKRVLK